MSRMPRENQNKLIPLGSSKQDIIMQLRISILLFFVVALGYAQGKKSKADIYFYQYDYAAAIREYQKEMGKAVIQMSEIQMYENAPLVTFPANP